ncbi:MAG: outer membrane beta-barrel protein [Chitinophagales bacterium]
MSQFKSWVTQFSPLIFILLLYSNLSAQDKKSRVQKDPEKGAINIEVTAGLNITTPVGVSVNNINAAIENRSKIYPDYEANLYPKTAAYVGVLFDYQFHEIAAIGSGLMYTPKGFWLFEDNVTEPGLTNPIFYERRKTFITVDYFDIPLYIKTYFKNGLISLRFGPVISMALLSKVRIEAQSNGQHEKDKYRLGEGSNSFIHQYSDLPNSIPKFIVPGFEAVLNIGNTGGLQGSLVIGFSGSLIEAVDIKSIIARLGISYTITK